ncbi:MAG: hypothetical protein ACM3WU_04350 [Bacillota bacterium]
MLQIYCSVVEAIQISSSITLASVIMSESGVRVYDIRYPPCGRNELGGDM